MEGVARRRGDLTEMSMARYRSHRPTVFTGKNSRYHTIELFKYFATVADLTPNIGA
jgi:hypothetical protein